MPGLDSNRGAKRARELRAELGFEPGAPLPCVLTVAEAGADLPVVVAGLPPGIAGCCWRGAGGTVLWVNGVEPVARRRFTLAHELGHVRCGHDGDLAPDDTGTLAGRTTDPREIQANAFAAELLAPAAGVRALVDGEPTLEDVVLIAARFGVSPHAALIRLVTLGLTKREHVLRGELDAGLHHEVRERLAPRAVADVLAALEPRHLPRLSPRLRDSALAALADGNASVADAAVAAGCEPRRLARGAAAIGV
jgi:IrrE N-terminal-like domain